MLKRDGQLSVRLPSEILESLDEMAMDREVASPGVRVTRADIARMLLIAGIKRANAPVPQPEGVAVQVHTHIMDTTESATTV